MSPTRPSDGRRNSSTSFKPYTRSVSPIITQPMSPLLPQHDNNIGPPPSFHPDSPTAGSPPPSRPVEHHGFPTYNQYKQVEAAYLNSLTPRRQGKALISQSLFDRIWDVLQQPDIQGETAQFRFWARKMFTISKNHPVTLGQGDSPPVAPESAADGSADPADGGAAGDGGGGGGLREVLLHDNLLVAVQEQLYDLLCYCHGSTGHGGRDKTCALIRKHYTWVPKDLVSNFIKACPTCIMKKCGGFDSSSIAAAQAASGMSTNSVPASPLSPFHDIRPEDIPLPIGGSDFSGSGGDSPDGSILSSPLGHSPTIPWSSNGSPNEVQHHPHGSPTSILNDDSNDPLEIAYREAILRSSRNADIQSGVPSTPLMKELHGHPMTREVSLYQGLPNGWQYRYPDYATAHAEFMKLKEQQRLVDMSGGSSSLAGPSGSGSGEQHQFYHSPHQHPHHPSTSTPFQRPRVPSILPLWGPNDYPLGDFVGDLTTEDMLGHMSTNADHGSVGSSSMDGYLLLRHNPNPHFHHPQHHGHHSRNGDGGSVGSSLSFCHPHSQPNGDHGADLEDVGGLQGEESRREMMMTMSRMVMKPDPQIDPTLLALESHGTGAGTPNATDVHGGADHGPEYAFLQAPGGDSIPRTRPSSPHPTSAVPGAPSLLEVLHDSVSLLERHPLPLSVDPAENSPNLHYPNEDSFNSPRTEHDGDLSLGGGGTFHDDDLSTHATAGGFSQLHTDDMEVLGFHLAIQRAAQDHSSPEVGGLLAQSRSASASASEALGPSLMDKPDLELPSAAAGTLISGPRDTAFESNGQDLDQLQPQLHTGPLHHPHPRPHTHRPAPLDLDALSTEKSFLALMAYRDSAALQADAESNGSPGALDSPLGFLCGAAGLGPEEDNVLGPSSSNENGDHDNGETDACDLDDGLMEMSMSISVSMGIESGAIGTTHGMNSQGLSGACLGAEEWGSFSIPANNTGANVNEDEDDSTSGRVDGEREVQVTPEDDPSSASSGISTSRPGSLIGGGDAEDSDVSPMSSAIPTPTDEKPHLAAARDINGDGVLSGKVGQMLDGVVGLGGVGGATAAVDALMDGTTLALEVAVQLGDHHHPESVSVGDMEGVDGVALGLGFAGPEV